MSFDHLNAIGFGDAGCTYLGADAAYAGDRRSMSDAEMYSIQQGIYDRDQLRKALVASEGETDPLKLTSAGALTPEELEPEIKMLTISEKHLTLWRDLQRLIVPVQQTIKQFIVQTGHGTDAGWTRQVELPDESQPDWQRGVGYLKILRTLYRTGDIASRVRAVQNLAYQNRRSAMIRLMRTFEWGMVIGNSALMPEWPDGIQTAIRNTNSPNHLIDMRGVAPTLDTFDEAALTLRDNFSTVEGWSMYCSSAGMTTLDRMQRTRDPNETIERFVPIPMGTNEYVIGSSMGGIKTGNGMITPVSNMMMGHVLESSFVPVRGNATNPVAGPIEGSTSVRAPDTPSIVVAPSGVAVPGSKWTDLDPRPSGAGTDYGYRVAACNRWGKSAASAVAKSGAVAVAGHAMNVTITPTNASQDIDYYEVYGQFATGDEALHTERRAFTVIGRIKANGNNPVVFQDLNKFYPRHTSFFILDTTTTGPDATLEIGQLEGMGVVNQPMAHRIPAAEAYITTTVMPMYIAPLRMIEIYNVPVARIPFNLKAVI